MKRILSLLFGIAVLATLGGLATAKAASSIKSSKSNTSDRVAVATPTPSPAKSSTITSTRSNTFRAGVDKATAKPKKTVHTEVHRPSPRLITGKVSQVGRGTFTLTAKGKEYKFALPKGGAQPKVGAIVDVTYTGALGGPEPAQSINLNSSRSYIY